MGSQATPPSMRLSVSLTRALVMFAVIGIGYAAGLDLSSTPVLVLLVLAGVGLGFLASIPLVRR